MDEKGILSSPMGDVHVPDDVDLFSYLRRHIEKNKDKPALVSISSLSKHPLEHFGGPIDGYTSLNTSVLFLGFLTLILNKLTKDVIL